MFTQCLHKRQLSHFNTEQVAGWSNLPSKLGQIGPKWDKCGEQKCTVTDLKKFQICPIWAKSDPIWVEPWHPCVRSVVLRQLIKYRRNVSL